MSPQVFPRCLRVRSASVVKSAPPSLSSSLILTAITNLHTATAHPSKTTLNNSNHSSSNKSNRHHNSNTLTRKRN